MTPPLDAKLARAVAHWEAVWQERFQERAAIREFDGGMPRAEAEGLAAAELGLERMRASKGKTRRLGP